MAGITSTAARLRVAKQSGKGTAASSGFITAVLNQSGLNVAFDNTQKPAEHGIAYSRATARKTATRRGSYLGRGTFRGSLYPDAFGLWLLGAGFAVTTSGASANKTHTFKLAARDANPWLTVLWDLNSNERRLTDTRVTRLLIDGSPEGVYQEGDFAGLTVGESTGSETTTAEDTVGEMLPSNGTLTLQYDPAGTPVTVVETPTDSVGAVQITINNPVDENDRSIHRFARADLKQTGVDVSVALRGLDIDWDIYNYIVNGGASAAAPSANSQIFSLTYSFESTVNIAGTAAPYSATITIPRLELTIEDFRADGDSMVTWNTTGNMLDQTTDPITIALVSKKASY